MKRASVSSAILILLGFWFVVPLAFAGGTEPPVVAQPESTAVPTTAPTADVPVDEAFVVNDTHGTHATLIQRLIVQVGSDYADPVTRAAGDHPDFLPLPLYGGPAPWPVPGSADCAELGLGTISATTGLRPRICAKKWVCGSERIDDVVSGDIAGEEASGRYAELLTGVVGLVGSVSNNPLPSVNSVSDFLIDRGLTAGHDEGQLPELLWCGKKPRTGGDATVEVVTADPLRAPRFGWTTSIEVEYNLPGLRADTLSVLDALLGLNEPKLAAVPPIDNGFTWVQWPTWFWVDSDTEPLEVSDESDAHTLRIDMRAVVDRVEWTFDGKPLRVCALDQMLAYDEQAHDPVKDVPECSYRFLQAVSADLEATVFYNIEERIRSRVENKNVDYADTPWVPTPGVGQIPLSTEISDYQVREIYSVNTPINMTDEEIAELLRNE